MPRDVDKRKTRNALRRLKRAAERAAERVSDGEAPVLTDWEKDFVAGVTERLETYGSAFRDPTKGSLDEALSQRQTAVARAIDKKSRPKAPGAGNPEEKQPPRPRSGFKPKAKPSRARVRDINDDAPVEPAPEAPAPPKIAGRPRLRVISGGRTS